MLCFIDHQDRSAPRLVIRQQEPVHSVGQLFQAVARFGVINLQFVADRGQQFKGTQSGIEHDGQVDIVGQLLQERAVDRGLTGPHLPGEQNKTTAAANAV